MKRFFVSSIVCLAVFLGVAVCAAETLAPDREEAAVGLLERLYVLQDKQAAKDTIREYVLRRKTGVESGRTTGSVSPADISTALEEINVASVTFAQRKFGIKNTDDPYEPLRRLNSAVRQSVGLQTLMEMFRQFGRQ